MPVCISAHSIDRASTRGWATYLKNRNGKEGLYSWLMKVCRKLLKEPPTEVDGRVHFYNWKGLRFVFDIADSPAVLMTIIESKDFNKNKWKEQI